MNFAPPAKWLALADAFYNASVDRSNGGQGIPSMWGIDAMHGHSNIITATLFPHNVGLGAMRDPALVEAIGKATAEENPRHWPRVDLRAHTHRAAGHALGPQL